MTPTTTTHSPLLLVLSLLTACGGQSLDVGSNNGSGGSDDGSGSTGAGAAAGYCNVEGTDPGPTLPEWPDGSACGGGSSPLQGVWSGYVQGNQQILVYPDNGNFTVNLAGDDGALCGTVTFGPPVSYPPATDPDSLPLGGFPLGADPFNPSNLMPGFSYTVLGAMVSGQRLQFQIGLSEPFRSWCEIQTSYFDYVNRSGYKCARNLEMVGVGTDGDSCRQVDLCRSEEVIVSCKHASVCMTGLSPCLCNQDGCGAMIEWRTRTFDLRVEDAIAEGVLDSDGVFMERN